MADSVASATSGRGSYKYLCGVPREGCCGSLGNLSSSFKAKGFTVHNTSTEAFNCHKNYLLSQGYEQLGAREFRPPGGGPIRVLTKRSRFGSKMRPGKAGRNMPGGRRTGGSATSC